MSHKLVAHTLVIAFMLFVHARAAFGQQHADFSTQQYVPFGPGSGSDFQWFAPVVDDALTGGPHDTQGFFFTYERLNLWFSKPDRASFGVANQQPQAAFYTHAINYQYTDDDLSSRTLLMAPGDNVLLENSIDAIYPMVQDGYGNRWEAGFVQDKWGWMVSIFDGVDVPYEKFYGIDDKRRDQLGAAQGIPGFDGSLTGIIDTMADITDPPIQTDPVAPTASEQALLGIDGLLTVHAIFDDPFGTLLGFVDNDGDGLADDLNGDLIVDFNDRVRYAVVFDDLRIRNSTALSGVELMSIRRKPPAHNGAFIHMFLGVRYLELHDEMDLLARGGVLADTSVSNRTFNRMIGPQFGFRVNRKSGRMSFGVQGRAMFAANFLTIKQDGTIADHLTPGQPGAPNVAPMTFFHLHSDEKFSPVGELRAEGSMRLTRDISVSVGWNGLIVGGITRASNSVVYSLPRMGILDRQEEMLAQGVSVGLQFNR